jgi:hypothetical protein
VKQTQLTREAYEEFEEILRHFDRVPDRFSVPVVTGLLALFEEIAANPLRGANHELATRMLGEAIR